MRSRRTAFLVLLSASVLFLLRETPAPAQAAVDTIAMRSRTPGVFTPVAPGGAGTFTYNLNIAVNTVPQTVVRLIGYEDGKGSAVTLSEDLAVTGGSHVGSASIAVAAAYTPSAGTRWLAVKAVLGAGTSPLATVDLPATLVMTTYDSTRVSVYSSVGVAADAINGYAAAYDAAWQQIGAQLGSYNDAHYAIYLTADPDTYEQVLLMLGVSPNEAAAAKTGSTAFNSSRNIMTVKGPVTAASYTTMGHEYAENRFHALLPGNQGAGWFWDGMADAFGLQVADGVPAARCQASSLRMSRWSTALNAVRDNRYLPLASIETHDQWFANLGDAAKNPAQYAEGYAAVEYLINRYGLSKVIDLIKAPKSPGNLDAALTAVFGAATAALEQDFLATVRPNIGAPAPPIQVTVHLDPQGTTSQTYILLDTYFPADGTGLAFSTRRNVPPGDYAFEITGDGNVRSTDGKATLTSRKLGVSSNIRGRVLVGVGDPKYAGSTGTGGLELLGLLAVHGRAGLSYKSYQVADASTKSALAGAGDQEPPLLSDTDNMPDTVLEATVGDCLSAWPDGNQITATVAAVAPTSQPAAPGPPGPSLGLPAHGAVLPELGAKLTWSNPVGVTQYQLRVTPANNDGPAINIIRNAEAAFTVEAPVAGKGPYLILPGMTYEWKVRTTAATAGVDENDPGWSAWSEARTFRTPVRDSSRIKAVAPADGAATGTTAQALRWDNADLDVFYYEIQVSPDASFETDPAKATSFVWTNLVHGGVTTPANSFVTPALQAGVTYYWRVRPRIQGDGQPVAWSLGWRFRAQ